MVDLSQIIKDRSAKHLAVTFVCALMAVIPAFADAEKAAPRKEVLDPAQFNVPIVRLSYEAAKSHPEIIEKLFCYCGCDLTASHSSLLDCFRSDHGVTCDYCQEEALLAAKLKMKGASLASIQKQVDQEFTKFYPFEQDTPAYKNYKNTRLWKADAKSTEQSGKVSAETKDNSVSATPKLKPGREIGNCCSGEKQSQKKDVTNKTNPKQKD
jgi:hypothetical protein